jgi:tRNA 2-thiouridine synthesizing protein C
MSIAIINRSSPYGNSNGQESLDLVLAASSFGQQISLIFLEDGVYQLLRSQAPEAIEHKNYSKTFAALTFYDVEDLYVCSDSLSKRNLSIDNLCIEIKPVTSNQIAQLLLQHTHILSF